MTKQQRAYLTYLLFTTPTEKRSEILKTEINNFGISHSEIQNEIKNIFNFFDLGIKNINQKQLSNLLDFIKDMDSINTELKKSWHFMKLNKNIKIK